MLKKIELSIKDLSKKFNTEWIFKSFSFDFLGQSFYVFTGPNGSGKSTILLCLTGQIPVTNGTINLRIDDLEINDIWKEIAISAPYLELIEEFTLLEFLTFHSKFKNFKDQLLPIDIIEKLGLEKSSDKQIKYFSSGMKQRVKLGLCFYSNCQILFFDEPTMNLDQNGVEWYNKNIQLECSDKLVFIFSNQPSEYNFTRNIFKIDSKNIVQTSDF